MFSTHTDKRSSGFTLAELLVAIAIISIMLAVALPALTGISAESRLEGAANSVHAAVKMARQHAVTYKQPTYVLFHDFISTSNSTLACRSYAVYTINTRERPVTPAAGSFLLDWQSLPAGIVFDNQTTENLNNVFIQGDEDLVWTGGFNRNNLLKVNGTVYPVLAVSTEGMQRRDLKNDIFITEGLYDDNGALVQTAPSGIRIRFDSQGRSTIAPVYYTESGKAEGIAR